MQVEKKFFRWNYLMKKDTPSESMIRFCESCGKTLSPSETCNICNADVQVGFQESQNMSRSNIYGFNRTFIGPYSDSATRSGKRLSELNVSFECPDIPMLGIKGGPIDVQRFIYWNFLKCFWKEDLGFELSKSTNYDWYAPSNAKRYSKEEFLKLGNDNCLKVCFFHQEEACYSARFKKI